MKQNKLLHFARGLTAALVVTGLVAGAFPASIDRAVGLSTYAAAATSDLTITNYVSSSRKIEKGDTPTITVTLRDPKTLSPKDEQEKSKLETTIQNNTSCRVSSFSGAKVDSVSITSPLNTADTSAYPLEFEITFKNAKYSGSGKDFSFQVGYNNSYENLEMTLTECKEYVEPEPEPEEPDDPLDEPVVQIGRDSIPANLSAGQVFTVNVWVKNLGDADIESGALTVSPSSGLTVADASPSYSLGRLRDGKTASFPVRLRVLDSVDNENQSIDVSLRFRYDDGVSSTLKSGTAEQTLLLSVTLPPENDTAPIVQIGRRSQTKAIAKGETQVVSLWVRNLSDVDLASTLATVSPSSGLMIADNSATYLLGAIPAGGTVTFDVRVKAPGDIDSVAQSLNVSLKYNYMKGRATTQGTTEENIPLSAVATPVSDGTQLAASTPNIIISNYSFGGAQVTAGTTFDLTLEFQNTSASKRVENIVMTLDTGTALAITSSSNSFHFASLGAGGKLSQTVNLQALPDAPSAPAAISVRFSYEYVDNSTRQNVTVDQTISLPVYQLDRFELTQDSPSIEAWQYEEAYLTLSYVNKGKSAVYNVAAELVGDVGAASRVQNVGNIDAGKSGTIDFIITPEMAGENECTLIVTYEDDAMQLLQKEFTFQVFVNEMYIPEDPGMDDPGMMEPEKTGPNWGLIVGILAAVAVIAGIFVLLRRRKKKKAAEVDSFTFDDSLMIDEPADAPAPSDEPTQPIHTETDGEGAHESE
ncbi:MAG: LPXTG cell wall anchor domain-containing protein [Butyricicoccus sp.]